MLQVGRSVRRSVMLVSLMHVMRREHSLLLLHHHHSSLRQRLKIPIDFVLNTEEVPMGMGI